ncbi:MAG: 30S ribosomal protein S8e [Euryarchaeota archaeon]|nr:30S ribosomal protein S8e [Euryarchaeota archaeon]
MKYQGGSIRKPTGGMRTRARKKKRFELGSEPTFTLLGGDRRKTVRTRGGNSKVRLFRGNTANVTDPKTGKTRKVAIETVVENRANPYFVRRNIITKGAVIRTPLGPARVTSRPGQEGVVHAILLPKEG